MSDFELLDEDQVRSRLERCNHTMAKALLVRQFAGGVIPKRLAALLDEYFDNPCAQTVSELVKFDSKLIAVFELALDGGFTESLFRKGELVVDLKTTRMLRREPEFEEYCDSVIDDLQIHKQLKTQLRSKGYTDEIIDEAVAEYWSDMASNYDA